MKVYCLGYLSNRSNGACITILILSVIINTPAPPVFDNTLILYNGKTLPLFVNLTVASTDIYVIIILITTKEIDNGMHYEATAIGKRWISIEMPGNAQNRYLKKDRICCLNFQKSVTIRRLSAIVFYIHF